MNSSAYPFAGLNAFGLRTLSAPDAVALFGPANAHSRSCSAQPLPIK
jgi:hypothetical protein